MYLGNGMRTSDVLILKTWYVQFINYHNWVHEWVEDFMSWMSRGACRVFRDQGMHFNKNRDFRRSKSNPLTNIFTVTDLKDSVLNTRCLNQTWKLKMDFSQDFQLLLWHCTFLQNVNNNGLFISSVFRCSSSWNWSSEIQAELFSEFVLDMFGHHNYNVSNFTGQNYVQ